MPLAVSGQDDGCSDDEDGGEREEHRTSCRRCDETRVHVARHHSTWLNSRHSLSPNEEVPVTLFSLKGITNEGRACRRGNDWFALLDARVPQWLRCSSTA